MNCIPLLLSQDISHVLMSVFKGVYNKDIIAKGNLLSNLIKTNVGKNNYHDKYVKELHQVTSGTKVFKFISMTE